VTDEEEWGLLFYIVLAYIAYFSGPLFGING
jgi:hypothetical protein